MTSSVPTAAPTAAPNPAIAQLGNPILRTLAQPVPEPQAPWVGDLIESLLANLGPGVGIAAPQIGQPHRVVIIASHPSDRYPQAPTMEPLALINPQIVAWDPATVEDWEGCLSVPGLRGCVGRAQGVTVEFYDRQGQFHRREFRDFVARIVQHELDHLDGLVFLDRVKATTDLMVETEWRKRILPPQGA
jgi:peptide deformylase